MTGQEFAYKTNETNQGSNYGLVGKGLVQSFSSSVCARKSRLCLLKIIVSKRFALSYQTISCSRAIHVLSICKYEVKHEW